MSNIREPLLEYRCSNENETKVAMIDVLKSDISIIDKQLKENLNLELKEDELFLLSSRINDGTYLNNKEIILKKRKNVYKKILNRNSASSVL
jgi:hypothetical protein